MRIFSSRSSFMLAAARLEDLWEELGAPSFCNAPWRLATWRSEDSFKLEVGLSGYAKTLKTLPNSGGRWAHLSVKIKISTSPVPSHEVLDLYH